jgi:Fur family transcriptional regulator, ferric uptake regulator
MKSKYKTDLRALIREKGLRATPARIAVCEALQQAPGPLTHAEVAKLLDDRGTDQTTVFRNLSDLTEVGLVRRLEVGDHLYRFEWSGSPGTESGHAHFVCVECGEVTCLHDMSAESATPVQRAAKRGIGTVTEVLYKGHCTDCE